MIFCVIDPLTPPFENLISKKTQYQIIKEYHESKGKEISEKEILFLQKRYRQREPDQFLSMYDSIRDKSDTEKKN